MSGLRMLATDLDGTLLGEVDALDRFRTWRANEGASVVLVYATGRTTRDVSRLVAQKMLPRPDFIVGSLGTELLEYGRNQRVQFGPARAYPRWDALHVRRILERFPEVELQPSEFQSCHKVSFFLTNAKPKRIAEIEAALRTGGIDFEALYSGARFFDVLPRGVSKGAAVRLIAQKLWISPLSVLAAGDSGNDVTLFLQGFRGVVVANAEASLKKTAPTNTYHSPFRFADGVLDGFRRWHRIGQSLSSRSDHNYSW